MFATNKLYQKKNVLAGVLGALLLASIIFLIYLHGFSTKVVPYDGDQARSESEAQLRLAANSIGHNPPSDEGYAVTNETIHLAVVCGGYSSTRSLYVLLKSILFHRTDAIHLHLFVDNISHRILQELFGSWLVDKFEVSYYNQTKLEKEVSWISNSHYSRHFGLMKLELVSILADNKKLEKVIILDTDTLVLGNIRYVWREFNNFALSNDGRKDPIFGMVENQSDWYQGLGVIRRMIHLGLWPALGRGYNSGIILVDLTLLRSEINWSAIWRDEADTQLIAQLDAPLADQDIFNAIFSSRSWLVHKLPCSFNLQLNDHSRLDELCPNRSFNLQIPHWNSPRKLDTTNPSAKIFKNWYINFRNWDAKLLEATVFQKAEKQSEGQKLTVSESRDEFRRYCDNMRPNLNDRLRVYPYFMDFEFQTAQLDVTYVVHLSIDRLQVLDELAQRWYGPISAAIYLPEQETDLLISFIGARDNLSKRKNIGYHLVFRDHGFNYPINRMRNIALNHTLTPYVFLCDIDFLPPSKLYEYLKQSISTMINEQGQDALRNIALVVPAFESKEYKFKFPENKQELQTRLNLGEVTEFREKIWPEGHKQTNFGKWKSSSDVYDIEWARDFEPFIVTGKDVPRFDERFIGFGWNKVEHTTQLAALGYRFLVLPEAFVIHKIHSPSFDIENHRESLYYKKCIIELRKTFLDELRAKYPKFMNEVYAFSKGDDVQERFFHSPPGFGIIQRRTIDIDLPFKFMSYPQDTSE